MPPAKELAVQSDAHIIRIVGFLESANVRRVLAAIHDVAEVGGYREIEIDFSHCTRAGLGSMLGIIARCHELRQNGADIEVELPVNSELQRLFINTNWATMLCPDRFAPAKNRIRRHLPVRHFTNADQQFEVVSDVMDTLLGSLVDLNLDSLASIEWSLNEITDNVINHSQSTDGGFVQVTTFGSKKIVQIAVCDMGVGIPRTLRTGHPEIVSDQEALDKAVRQGVTRGKKFGQGNGLFGTWRLAQMSNGNFFINTGYASLVSTPRVALHVRRENIPLRRTLISLHINYVWLS